MPPPKVNPPTVRWALFVRCVPDKLCYVIPTRQGYIKKENQRRTSQFLSFFGRLRTMGSELQSLKAEAIVPFTLSFQSMFTRFCAGAYSRDDASHLRRAFDVRSRRRAPGELARRHRKTCAGSGVTSRSVVGGICALCSGADLVQGLSGYIDFTLAQRSPA